MKWEYMVRHSLAIPSDDEQEQQARDALDRVGKDGWELVSVVVGELQGTQTGSTSGWDTPTDTIAGNQLDSYSSASLTLEATSVCYYFKRPIQ
jgi:hypothetical protein